MDIFTFICCKNCIVCLKRQKLMTKRPGLAHFLKKHYEKGLSTKKKNVRMNCSHYFTENGREYILLLTLILTLINCSCLHWLNFQWNTTFSEIRRSVQSESFLYLNMFFQFSDVIFSLAISVAIGHKPGHGLTLLSSQLRIFLSKFFDEIFQLIFPFRMVCDLLNVSV